MQLAASALIFLILLIWMIAAQMPRRLVVLFAAFPFGASAVVTLPSLGGASILVPNLLAVAILLVYFTQKDALGRLLAQMQPWKPGFFLAVLIAVAMLLTTITPNLFAGTVNVFNAVSDASGQRQIQYLPLRLSATNVTQSLYLLQSALVFFVVAAVLRRYQEPQTAVRAIEVATIVNLLIVAVDSGTHAAGWGNLFSWLRSANYSILDHATLSGVRRVVGAFSEASSFGYFTSGLFGFWVMYWIYGGQRKFSLVYIIALMFALIFSTSTSAYAAMGGLLLIVVAQGVRGLFAAQVSPRQLTLLALGSLLLPLSVLGTILALDAIPWFYSFIDQIVFSKLDSQSGVERGSWNREALNVFWSTWWLGAGLGSVRASSFVVSTLATIGLPGALLMFAFLYSLFTQKTPSSGPERAIVSGAKTGCIVMILHASVVASSPDLGLLFFSLAAILYAFGEQKNGTPSSYQRT